MESNKSKMTLWVSSLSDSKEQSHQASLFVFTPYLYCTVGHGLLINWLY